MASVRFNNSPPRKAQNSPLVSMRRYRTAYKCPPILLRGLQRAECLVRVRNDPSCLRVRSATYLFEPFRCNTRHRLMITRPNNTDPIAHIIVFSDYRPPRVFAPATANIIGK
jgi:hypothetical protein